MKLSAQTCRIRVIRVLTLASASHFQSRFREWQYWQGKQEPDFFGKPGLIIQEFQNLPRIIFHKQSFKNDVSGYAALFEDFKQCAVIEMKPPWQLLQGRDRVSITRQLLNNAPAMFLDK